MDLTTSTTLDGKGIILERFGEDCGWTPVPVELFRSQEDAEAFLRDYRADFTRPNVYHRQCLRLDWDRRRDFYECTTDGCESRVPHEGRCSECERRDRYTVARHEATRRAV